MQVSAFAAKMYALVDEGTKAKMPAPLQNFKDELAEAAALGIGARLVLWMEGWKPITCNMLQLPID